MEERNEILKDPCFAPLLTKDDAPKSEWGIFGAHDPSMIYADGAYYVFSTGTYGQNYYQIRKSEDLIRWEYVGQAFPRGIRASLGPVLSEMEECGARCCNDTLWAPILSGERTANTGCTAVIRRNSARTIRGSFWRSRSVWTGNIRLFRRWSRRAEGGAKRPTRSTRRFFTTDTKCT